MSVERLETGVANTGTVILCKEIRKTIDLVCDEHPLTTIEVLGVLKIIEAAELGHDIGI